MPPCPPLPSAAACPPPAGQFFHILGDAVPASSNFFINYVVFRALAMVAFRLFYPHAAVFMSILRWLRLAPGPCPGGGGQDVYV